MTKHEKCHKCGSSVVQFFDHEGYCWICWEKLHLASIWIMPRKTGYAYTAPVGSFWRTQ